MTPEERFKQIENLLHTITSLQARHEEAIVRHNEAVARHDEMFARNDAQLEKQNSGIQDLIRVSRTLVDSETKAWDAIHALSDRLDKLSETVSRWIQNRNGNH
jgi:hypothetical protein